MFYLNLDENNYLLSISTTEASGAPTIESIDEYDLSELRLMAYRYEDGRLVFDAERFEQLTKAQEEIEHKAYLDRLAPSETDLAVVELAGLMADNTARLDDQDAALCELAALIAEMKGGDV